MNKDTRKFVKYLGGVLLGTLIMAFFVSVNCTDDDTKIVQSNLVTGSGVLAGILFAVLSAKLFQLSDDRNKSKIILNEYADKLTQYRKLVFRTMKLHEFWIFKTHVNRFKTLEPNATFHTLHENSKESSRLMWTYWMEEMEDPIYHTTVDLYLAMEEITARSTTDSYWIYDERVLYDYDLNYLQRAEMPTNQIWYYLEGRYAKHAANQIDDTAVSEYEKEDLNALISSIDPMFQGRDFDRHSLAEVSTHVYEKILPEMIRLTYKRRQKLTSSIRNLFSSLVAILVAGLVIPLVLLFLDFGEKERLTTAFCIITVIVSLLVFLIDLYGIAIDDEQSIIDRDRVRVRPMRS